MNDVEKDEDESCNQVKVHVQLATPTRQEHHPKPHVRNFIITDTLNRNFLYCIRGYQLATTCNPGLKGHILIYFCPVL